MNTDAQTLSVYDQRADDYANMAVDADQNTMLKHFIQSMPDNGHVLDYGCGPGHAAAEMQHNGLIVDAIDASPKMVRLAAENSNVNVQLKSFDDLDAVDIYDGIWASFSLLHAPKSEFPRHLKAIHNALVSGGLLTLAMKLGQGEKRDGIGRFYAYYSKLELCDQLIAAGFKPGSHVLGESVGLAGERAKYIVINALA